MNICFIYDELYLNFRFTMNVCGLMSKKQGLTEPKSAKFGVLGSQVEIWKRLIKFYP